MQMLHIVTLYSDYPYQISHLFINNKYFMLKTAGNKISDV